MKATALPQPERGEEEIYSAVWHRRVSRVLDIPGVVSLMAREQGRDIAQLCAGGKGQLRSTPESRQPCSQLSSSISC